MKQVVFLLFDHVFDSAFSLLHDVLRTGARLAEAQHGGLPFVCQAVSIRGDAVSSGSGQMLAVSGSIRSISRADLIVIPGLELLDSLAVNNFLADKHIPLLSRWLHKHYQQGTTIAACCTSTFLLARSGLLDDRVATTSWWYAEDFRKRFPRVKLQQDMMITKDASLICGGAAMAHMDLGLALLDHLVGPDLSHGVARYLLLDGRSSQARYVISGHLAQSNDGTRKAEAWIRENIREPISIQDIADAVGVSPRTLARRMQEAIGQTPHHFVQRLKVERAVYLLQTTDWSFEVITEEVGYVEPASLRRLIRKHTGHTPSQHRKVFQGST